MAWVLNLDAEEQLRAPGRYRRSSRMAAKITELARELGGLIGEGDLVLAPGEGAGGRPGRCWCPTAEALERLREAGVEAPSWPPAEVLGRVNGRSFGFALARHELPGARLVRDPRELPKDAPGDWVLKRELGFAGRGMRRVCFPLERAAGRWLEARLEEDGVVLLEPWVERVVDLAWHGWVTRCGRVELGVPTIQQCNASGRWCGSRPVKAGELGGGCEARLRGAARRAGEALAEAGYHGPYGIDGYRWRDGAGGEHLRALGEINARYSMGWAVGTGAAGRRWVLEDP